MAQAVAPMNSQIRVTDSDWRTEAYVRERSFYYIGAYCGYGYMGLAALFFLTCGWFPAHDPTWAPTELQSFYNDNLTRLRVGTIGCMTVVALYIPYYMTVSKILEYKMKMPFLGRLQMYASIQAGMFVFLMFLCWAIALYRPERDPEITQAFNDWGWMMAWWTVNTTEVQFLAWAGAILFCRPENQLFKRWLGYLWLLAFMVQIFAWTIPAVKTGPFAYNGVLLYFCLILGYGASVLLSTMQTVKALRIYDEKIGLERWSLFRGYRSAGSTYKNAGA